MNLFWHAVLAWLLLGSSFALTFFFLMVALCLVTRRRRNRRAHQLGRLLALNRQHVR